MSDPFKNLDDIQFNAQDLWREEVYTDRSVGSIRVLEPVTVTGERDLKRKVEYFAQTQVMTGSGPLPVEGPIEAESLEEAIEGFGGATKKAVEDMIERAREMQRESANQIVTPGDSLGGGMGGGQPGGGQGPNPFTLR